MGRTAGDQICVPCGFLRNVGLVVRPEDLVGPPELTLSWIDIKADTSTLKASPKSVIHFFSTDMSALF